MDATNHIESLVNQAPLTKVDKELYNDIGGITLFSKKFEEQEYVKQCTEREANGLAAILPTKEQLNSMRTALGTGNSELLNEALDRFKSSKHIGNPTKT